MIMKHLPYFLLISLMLIGCANDNSRGSEEKGAISIASIYDPFTNNIVSPSDNAYVLKPLLCYDVYFTIDKRYFYNHRLDTLQNQLTFKYNYEYLTISRDYDYRVNEDSIDIHYMMEAISDFDEASLIVSCYEYSASYTFKLDNTLQNIGKSNIEALDEDIVSYINQLDYYPFEKKQRLSNVDKALFNVQGGKNNKVVIDIKTNDVERFIFDSVYLPKTPGNNNYINYNSAFFDFDIAEETNTYFGLFISDSTERYPFIHYHSENDSFAFDCYNKKASLLKIDFFNAYKESFYKTQINGLDCYLWKKGEVYIPFDVLNGEEGSIISAFSYGDYIYFVTSLNNN